MIGIKKNFILAVNLVQSWHLTLFIEPTPAYINNTLSECVILLHVGVVQSDLLSVVCEEGLESKIKRAFLINDLIQNSIK